MNDTCEIYLYGVSLQFATKLPHDHTLAQIHKTKIDTDQWINWPYFYHNGLQCIQNDLLTISEIGIAWNTGHTVNGYKVLLFSKMLNKTSMSSRWDDINRLRLKYHHILLGTRWSHHSTNQNRPQHCIPRRRHVRQALQPNTTYMREVERTKKKYNIKIIQMN